MKIVHSERCLQFPHNFPKGVRDLISKLLQPNQTLRLGMLRGGIGDIKHHAWFEGVNYAKLASALTEAPRHHVYWVHNAISAQREACLSRTASM